eukprot:jgi/Mesvir1/25713/Mv25995-RA.1
MADSHPEGTPRPPARTQEDVRATYVFQHDYAGPRATGPSIQEDAGFVEAHFLNLFQRMVHDQQRHEQRHGALITRLINVEGLVTQMAEHLRAGHIPTVGSAVPAVSEAPVAQEAIPTPVVSVPSPTEAPPPPKVVVHLPRSVVPTKQVEQFLDHRNCAPGQCEWCKSLYTAMQALDQTVVEEGELVPEGMVELALDCLPPSLCEIGSPMVAYIMHTVFAVYPWPSFDMRPVEGQDLMEALPSDLRLAFAGLKPVGYSQTYTELLEQAVKQGEFDLTPSSNCSVMSCFPHKDSTVFVGLQLPKFPNELRARLTPLRVLVPILGARWGPIKAFLQLWWAYSSWLCRHKTASGWVFDPLRQAVVTLSYPAQCSRFSAELGKAAETCLDIQVSRNWPDLVSMVEHFPVFGTRGKDMKKGDWFTL